MIDTQEHAATDEDRSRGLDDSGAGSDRPPMLQDTSRRRRGCGMTATSRDSAPAESGSL